jgi:pimeloyl-ACP methyl ester carboxylesterase
LSDCAVSKATMRYLVKGRNRGMGSSRNLRWDLQVSVRDVETRQPAKQVPFTNPDGSEGVDLYLYLDQEAFPAVFAGDVDPEAARVMAATQRPWSAAALSAPSGPPAWKSSPSWYLVGTEDKAIPAATQRFMAERATATIEEVAASHASMVSQPDVATNLIVTAVNATVGAVA